MRERFQFHYGSIRTLHRHCECRRSSCFNSIMVQLERTGSFRVVFVVQFQFHYGSIRTVWIGYVWLAIISFNSIMVQLEPITTRIVTSSFTMGFGDLLVKDLSLKNVDI